MLQVVTHSQNAGAEDVDEERAQWEGGGPSVEVFRRVEPCETTDGCEDEGERRPWLPVWLWGEDGEEDGAEPAAEGEEDS